MIHDNTANIPVVSGLCFDKILSCKTLKIPFTERQRERGKERMSLNSFRHSRGEFNNQQQQN